MIQDPESSNQSSSISSQHIFHILKSREDSCLKGDIALLFVYSCDSDMLQNSFVVYKVCILMQVSEL